MNFLFAVPEDEVMATGRCMPNHFCSYRQTKVTDFEGSILRDQDIPGLDVAVALNPMPGGVLHPETEPDCPDKCLISVESSF